MDNIIWSSMLSREEPLSMLTSILVVINTCYQFVDWSRFLRLENEVPFRIRTEVGHVNDEHQFNLLM